MTTQQAIDYVRSKAAGRTRYIGQDPFLDELLVLEIDRLSAELAKAREAMTKMESCAEALKRDAQFVRSHRPIARALEESRTETRTLAAMVDRSDATDIDVTEGVSVSRTPGGCWFVYIDQIRQDEPFARIDLALQHALAAKGPTNE